MAQLLEQLVSCLEQSWKCFVLEISDAVTSKRCFRIRPWSGGCFERTRDCSTSEYQFLFVGIEFVWELTRHPKNDEAGFAYDRNAQITQLRDEEWLDDPEHPGYDAEFDTLSHKVLVNRLSARRLSARDRKRHAAHVAFVGATLALIVSMLTKRAIGCSTVDARWTPRSNRRILPHQQGWIVLYYFI